VLLRVVQSRERTPIREREPLQVEQDSRGDEGTGERAASGLVCAGDEAPLERAVEGEEAAAAARRARAFRLGPAAST
jgi:hypothetical protein